LKLSIKNKVLVPCSVGVLLATIHMGVNAGPVDDAAEACIDAARLIQEEDDLEGAIEEATWCLTGLTQLREEIKLSLFPDELNGYTGGEIDNENAMGLNVIKRSYTSDNRTIDLTLTTTSGAGAGAFGALGELGKLFGAMESAGGLGLNNGKKIRIQKRTVIVSDAAGKGSLNVQLKSGGSLTVESSELNSDALVEFMRDFPIAELDDAMER